MVFFRGEVWVYDMVQYDGGLEWLGCDRVISNLLMFGQFQVCLYEQKQDGDVVCIVGSDWRFEYCMDGYWSQL